MSPAFTPEVNGQANSFEIGTQYGEYDGKYYIFCDESWCELLDYETFIHLKVE